MPKYRITSPEGKTYEITAPDGTTQDQALAYFQQNYKPPVQQAPQAQEPVAPNTGMMAVNSANKAIAAVPDALLNTPNRVMNLLKAGFGTAATAMGHPEMAPQPTEDPNYVRQAFDKLGFTKSSLEPQTPGQRILDTSVQGAVSSAMSPANGLRQFATNAALGGLSGASAGATKEATGSDAAAMAAGMLTVPAALSAMNSAKAKIAATELRKQQNAVRDQTIADARKAGYVLSPSETNPTTLNQTLEGIAGKLSTRQLASQRNQEVTNQLARQSLGVSDNAALTPDLTQQVRREAYNTGYAPVESAGQIATGQDYADALKAIQSKYTGAARSFPSAVSDDVTNMVENLKVPQFDSGDAVKMTQILRDDASKNFRNGDTGLGKAQRDAANAIENQIESGLSSQGMQGGDLLSGFRNARQLMAKSHTVEGAINEGSGNVQASKLAAALRKGKPLSGDLALAARTADAFPKDMQSPENMGAIPGISPLDVFSGATLGALGSAATGSPVGALAAAVPAVRPMTRALLLSKPYQKMMGTPSYKNSMLAQILAQGDLQNPQANSALIAQILASQANGN